MSPKDSEARHVAGIRLTHPDRVLYDRQGLTKHDLAAYIEAAAPRMLPHVAGRLMSLVRCPQGRARTCFYQRHGGEGFPGEVRRLALAEKDGGRDDYLYVNGTEGLIAAVQMGTLEFHIWGSRTDAVEKPDRLVFDLDPDPAVPFADVKAAARLIRDALDALGLQSFAMLTGGKGIHVVAPIQRRHEWPVVKAFAKALAVRVAEDDPARYVAVMSKARRKGRIFLDYLRNERGSTAIAPYSPRAREGAPVAWPVTWRTLERIQAANAVSLPEAAKRLKEADPWNGYFALRQGLKAPALRALGVGKA